MKKSISSFLIVVLVGILIIIAGTVAYTYWFLLPNKPKPSPLGVISKTFSIALIKPTFTSAAYNKSFYKFYFLYVGVSHARKNVTNDLNLLSNRVTTPITRTSTSGFAIVYLFNHLRTLLPKAQIRVLSDADADSGSIFFKNGTNRYNVLVLGHQEYVTQKEYTNLKHFVSEGGMLILLDGNVFYVEVKYDRDTNTISFVKGHGWAFNGKSAWRSITERWANETSQWVGSNYLCRSCQITFGNNPFRYVHHEEQYVTNHNDRILLDYQAISSNKELKPVKPLIATYELKYQKGKVLVFGIFSDVIVTNVKFDRYFDDLLLQYADLRA
jgi:hypothetical protein